QVLLCTRQGMAIRFDESDARAMGRNTRGVKGINLQVRSASDGTSEEGDEVVGMVVADPEGYLLTVCANGYGKGTPFGANEAGPTAEAEDAPEAASETDQTEESEGAEGESRPGMHY